jgi:hypothetical protein
MFETEQNKAIRAIWDSVEHGEFILDDRTGTIAHKIPRKYSESRSNLPSYVVYIMRWCRHGKARYTRAVQFVHINDGLNDIFVQALKKAEKEFSSVDCVQHHNFEANHG